MKRSAILALACLLFLGSCVTTRPTSLALDIIDRDKARAELPHALLIGLKDFGNKMAALMLTEYQYYGFEETGTGAYLYRFDATTSKVPKHAYLVLRLEGEPSISTNVGEKNYIQLDKGSIGLVPTDEPALVSKGKFSMLFTKSGFMEAFNPWVIGEPGSYPTQLLLWFGNPATKDEDTRRVASLFTSAFPNVKYASE